MPKKHFLPGAIIKALLSKTFKTASSISVLVLILLLQINHRIGRILTVYTLSGAKK